MNQCLTRTDGRVMGSNCAQSSLCAYLKDTALAVVSFFATFRFFYFYYYGFPMESIKRDRRALASAL